MKIHLMRTDLVPLSQLEKILSLLLPFAGPMQFQLVRKSMLFEDDEFLFEDMFDEMNKFRKQQSIPPVDFLVCITRYSNAHNWFSSVDFEGGSNNMFIYNSNWEYFVYSEPEYPIAFEVVVNVLQRILSADGEKHEFPDYAHDPSIGCVNDLCIEKSEISLKMRTADICSDCLLELEREGGKDLIKQSIEILSSLRPKMLHSQIYLEPLSFEHRLPFTVAITKRKMGMTSQPFRKFLMMIDHFDSLIRTSVLMLASLYFPKRDEVESFFKENELTNRPALGSWVRAFGNLARMNLAFDNFELPNDFNKKLSEIVKLEQDRKITLIRNEKRGHGYIDCNDEGYGASYSDNLKVLTEIESHLSPLFYRFNYYFVRRNDPIGGRRFNIHGVDLSGSNSAFLESQIEVNFDDIDAVPAIGKCYLVSPNKQKWISLDPYLKFGICSECDHTRLLIQDGEVYLDPLIGHRVSL